MKINWFTVIAQIINFFLLVWLLRKFLYKPILDAIDEREKKIVSQIADAEAKKVEANKEQDEFKLKNETFDKEKKICALTRSTSAAGRSTLLITHNISWSFSIA